MNIFKKPAVLLAVDIQKGFVTKQSQHVVTPVQSLQHRFDDVVFTRFSNPDPSPFRRILDYQKMAPESRDAELALAPRNDALMIERHTYSAVTPELRRMLDNLPTREVYLCGIATEACVLKTVIDLFEYDVRPLVIADLCASDQDSKYHDMAMELMAKLIGKHNILCREALDKRLGA